jgi:hypothetical protein
MRFIAVRKLILLTTLITLSVSVFAKNTPMRVSEVKVVEDVAGTATQLLILGNDLCQSSEVNVEMPGLPGAVSSSECSSLADTDIIIADLSLVLEAGSYLLVVEASGNEGKGKKGDKTTKKSSDQFVFTWGISGPMGATGSPGEPGLKGDTGAQGEPGPEGDIGLVGDTGLQGVQGPQGETGPVGDKGERGENGLPGATGPAGAKGDSGIQGFTGAAGIKGDTGVKGEKGDKGDAGASGLSASHNYVHVATPWTSCSSSNGFDPLNPQDWIDFNSYLNSIVAYECELRVECPAGMVVTGGGVDTEVLGTGGTLELRSSLPSSNTSWSGRMRQPVISINYFDSSFPKYRVLAVCADLL